MKNLEKIDLIDKVARELQARMTFDKIDEYFKTYGIPTDHEPSYYSKYVYVKEILPKIDDTVILEIASELNLDHPEMINDSMLKQGKANFWKPGHFKLFMSHLAKFKSNTSKLKVRLEKYGISAFVAHEDIEPTKEWQDEIEKGLFSMDALCAILMPGFKKSNWTDQEVGIAIGLKVLVIPLRKGLDPYGFIGKYQGLQTMEKNIGEVADGIFQIISSNPKTREKYLIILSNLLIISSSLEDGINRLKILKKIDGIPDNIIKNIRYNILENDNLKNNKFIREFNSFIHKYNYPKLKKKEFESEIFEDDDDLPF